MKRIFFLLLLTFLIPVTNVNGYYCKFSEISRYKGLASNITTTYEYLEDESGLTFSITLANLSDELYIIDTTTQKTYSYKDSELTISGYSPGQTVKFAVYATNEYCKEDLLYTIRVVLPNYNPYYSDAVCEDASEYIYCQKWFNNQLDYETFVKRVNAYKNSFIEEPIIEPIVEEDSIWDLIMDVVVDYYYVILIMIIIICGTIIYVTEKKSDIYW